MLNPRRGRPIRNEGATEQEGRAHVRLRHAHRVNGGSRPVQCAAIAIRGLWDRHDPQRVAEFWAQVLDGYSAEPSGKSWRASGGGPEPMSPAAAALWSAARSLSWRDYVGKPDVRTGAAAVTVYRFSYKEECADDAFSFSVISVFPCSLVTGALRRDHDRAVGGIDAVQRRRLGALQHSQ